MQTVLSGRKSVSRQHLFVALLLNLSDWRRGWTQTPNYQKLAPEPGSQQGRSTLAAWATCRSKGRDFSLLLMTLAAGPSSTSSESLHWNFTSLRMMKESRDTSSPALNLIVSQAAQRSRLFEGRCRQRRPAAWSLNYGNSRTHRRSQCLCKCRSSKLLW